MCWKRWSIWSNYENLRDDRFFAYVREICACLCETGRNIHSGARVFKWLFAEQFKLQQRSINFDSIISRERMWQNGDYAFGNLRKSAIRHILKSRNQPNWFNDICCRWWCWLCERSFESSETNGNATYCQFKGIQK